MKLKILGCGTSTGVPIPGCRCDICTSGKEKNNRTRTSALITTPEGKNLLIDTSSDFRYQALTWKISHIDAVLYTHSHSDHISGIDDLRGYNFVSKEDIPCYGAGVTLAEIRKRFSYIFEPNPGYQGGLPPQLDLNEIEAGKTFKAAGLSVKPFLLKHGSLNVMGYRFGKLAYATDCKIIPEESIKTLKGLDYLILDGLRYEGHATHMTIPEAIECAADLGVKKTILTHMTHTIDYKTVSSTLPEEVELAYDGMEIEFN